MRVDVTTHYLEMLSPSQLKAKTIEIEGLQIIKAEVPSADLQHFLYRSVGGDWFWYEKANWNYAQWLEYAQNPNLHTFVAYIRGTPAGYFQLEVQPKSDIEITYFGLMTQFLGMGLGGHILTLTIQTAWAMGANRVWLHTCSLDHASALANYQARGFSIYKSETENLEVPEHTPGPWNGAR